MAGGAAEGTATAVAAGSAGLSARASTTGAESAGELSALFFFWSGCKCVCCCYLSFGDGCFVLGAGFEGSRASDDYIKSHTPHVLMLGFFVGASLCADGGVSCWRGGGA